jgi:hypothetical protein
MSATAPASGAGTPFVSVIVPCRNEARHVVACLDSLRAGYPADRLEVLVADGRSDDGTREIVEAYARRVPGVRLIDNPRRIVPAGLNLALAEARGEIIVRADAHCRFPAGYVAGLVGWLVRSGADNVGAACRTRAAGPSAVAQAIALALAHPFGVGGARFRLGTRVARRVDTVPFGCFRREVFARVGTFDEELVRDQDDEFNHRLLRSGGAVLLVPGLEVEYEVRASWRQAARMYWQYGLFKPLVVRKTGRVMTLRQLVPPVFVVVLGAALAGAAWWPAAARLAAAVGGAYGALALAAAAHAGVRHGPRCVAALAVTFPVLHLSYGAGYVAGALRLLGGRRPRADDDLPLSR